MIANQLKQARHTVSTLVVPMQRGYMPDHLRKYDPYFRP